MYKVLLFAGTTEGRILARFLARRGAWVCACVATEYGREALKEEPNLVVRAGRLEREEMILQIRDFDCVVDATHPYADKVSDNIRSACGKTGKECIRVIRAEKSEAGCVYVRDAAEAAVYLGKTQGNVMLATGSKDLDVFTRMQAERLYPRILPDAGTIERCRNLGIPSKNIICMEGPFSMELNLAILRQVDARWMVTKESGREGGFQEKVHAAQIAGVTVVVIGRPAEETGVSVETAKKILAEKLGRFPDKKMFPLFISLAGKKAVVFGGGKIALRRIRTLLEFGCGVHVISPENIEEAHEVLECIRWTKREYQKGDCKDAALVLAATDNRTVNSGIAEECAALQIPVSVADCSEECTFYFPAIIRQGKLTAGITSDGSDHIAVKRAAQAIGKTLKHMDESEEAE